MSLVSIVIPCYNDGAYLLEAVASATRQTHPELEIIVVDDHSDDPATLKTLDDLRASGAVQVIVNRGSRGPAAARNLGIGQSAGPYILPLDADDFLHPTYAAKAAAVLDQRPEVGVCYCKGRFFGRRRGAWRLPAPSKTDLLFDNMIFVSAMFRKADWRAVGGFDESLTMGDEDHSFWLAMVHRGVGVHQIDEVLFDYRIKKGSRSARVNRDGRTSIEALYKAQSGIFAENGMTIYREAVTRRRQLAQYRSLYVYQLTKPLVNLEMRLRNWTKRRLSGIR